MAASDDPFFDLCLGRELAAYKAVNKFGRSTNVDSGVDTDIWDRANATDDQDIWTAPTQARVHNLAGGVNDTAAGTGARTVMVYGLPSWAEDEVSEVVTMNGASAVPTSNAYVIIHRMHAVTWGTSGPNVAAITATAVTDGTVTAQINAGMGQTQMAIYGVPSVSRLVVCGYYASAIKASTALSASITALVNPSPDTGTSFLVKHTTGVTTEGQSYIRHELRPYYLIEGPAVFKLQANSSSANTDVSGGFDGVLVHSAA